MNKKPDDSLVESVLAKMDDESIDAASAAALLGVCERQVYKLRKARLSGEPKRPEKPARGLPSNSTDPEIRERVIELYKWKYRGFSYAHFREKLAEVDGIDIKLKTLSRILMRSHLISPFAQKKTVREAKKTLRSANEAVNHAADEQDLPIDDSIIFAPKDIHNRCRHIEGC